MNVRMGTESDAEPAAALHASEIDEGFLASLGVPLLTRLYRRIVRWPRSFLLVAVADGNVGGMVAATEETSGLYRAFLLHDGASAVLHSAPRLLRSSRRVIETLRYPSGREGAVVGEILAVAVARDARGQGLGRTLVDTATRELARRGVTTTEVVTAADNLAAQALYRTAGFAVARHLDVHAGTPSVVLVRR